jgi:hypothetical protein
MNQGGQRVRGVWGAETPSEKQICSFCVRCYYVAVSYFSAASVGYTFQLLFFSRGEGGDSHTQQTELQFTS